MKKFVLAGLFALAELDSQAQTLSKNDLTPVIGEKFLVQIYNNQPWISIENAGQNQIWDLSKITRSVEADKYYQVVEPASTPYIVPFASFAFRYGIVNDSISIGYKYFKDTLNGFYCLADNLPYRSNEYLNPEFIYKLPLNMNDSTVDYSCYSTELSTFYDELCGESGLKFDGTGTLMLPSGTYTDTYRLIYNNYYHRKSLNDTIYTQSWLWYKKGIHFPIAEYVKFTMSGVNYYTINFLNLSSMNGVSAIEKKTDLLVFPNPADRKLTIRNTQKSLNGFTISIFDLNGKQLLNEQIDRQVPEINLDLPVLKSGCYIYHISNKNEIGTFGKLIIN